MKKEIVFLGLISILFFISCKSEKFISKKENGHKIINNKIKKEKEIKNFKVIKKKKVAIKTKIHLYLHSANDDKLGIVTYKNSDKYLQLYDKELKLIKEMKLTNGSGPGEFGSWIPGMGMSENEIYILDAKKNSIEMFNKELNFIDSYPINSSKFRMSFGFTRVLKLPDSMLVAPVMSMSEDIIGAEMNFDGSLEKYIQGEEPEGKIKHFNIKNLVRTDIGPENKIYMVMIGYNNKYLLRKYNENLGLVWENTVDDGLQKTLSPEIITFKNGTFELNGGRACSNIEVDNNNLYVLRGVGGINKFEWKDNRKVRHHKDIEEIDSGFVDVFDKKTGKFKYRIKGDFLNTKQDYFLYILDGKYYFVSPYNSKYENDNTVYVAEIENK